jgi:hypothetical protein
VVTGSLDLTFSRMTTPPEVEIGTGTYDTSLPMEQFYGYSYSQSIYYSSELYPGPIHQISWRYNGYSSWSDTFVIYMGHTTKTAFASTSDYVPFASLTQVYSGTVTFATGSWYTFDLTTPFSYNGTDNLVIAVDKTTGTWTSGPGFYCSAVTGNRSVYYYQDSIDVLPSAPTAYSMAVTPYVPNVQIHY